MYACKAHNFLERHHICFLIEAENVQRVYILSQMNEFLYIPRANIRIHDPSRIFARPRMV